MNEPLVSICLPVKNGMSNHNVQNITLKEVLDQLSTQTYKNYEIIISDNCSTDGTLELIERYKKTNDKIKFYVQKKEISWAENFKFVMSKATGKYIKWNSADDLISNNFIEENVKFLENNEDYVFSASKFFFSKSMNDPHINNLNEDTYNRIKKFFIIRSVSHNLFFGLIRRDYLVKTTDISKNYLSIDWIINLELLLHGKFKTIEKGYMILGTNGMSRQKNFIKNKIYSYKIIYKILPLFELTKILNSKIFLNSKLNFIQKIHIFLICLKLNFFFLLKYKLN